MDDGCVGAKRRWGVAQGAAGQRSNPAQRACPGVVLELFCTLNPSLRRQQLQTFNWPKLLAGFVLSNAGAARVRGWAGVGDASTSRPSMSAPTPTLPLVRCAVIPLCIAYTFATRHIDWSGIRYFRHGGKVVRVQHSYRGR